MPSKATLQRVTIHSFYQTLSEDVPVSIFGNECFVSRCISSDYNYIAFVDTTSDRNLHIVELKSLDKIGSEKEFLNQTSVGIQDVESFAWESVFRTLEPKKIAVVQKSNKVLVLEIRKNREDEPKRFSAKCCWKLDKTVLKTSTERFNFSFAENVSVEILNYDGLDLHLLLDKTAVISFTSVGNDGCEASSFMHLNQSPIHHLRVVKDSLFVITDNNHLYGYGLTSGQIFMEMDLFTSGINDKKGMLQIKYFQVSVSMNYALLGTADHDFYRLLIDTSKEPSSLQKYPMSSISVDSPILATSFKPCLKSPVSAFVKQIPSLAKENGISYKTLLSDSCLKLVSTEYDLSRRNCFEVACFPQQIFFLFSKSGDQYEIIVINIEDGSKCYQEKFTHPVVLIHNSASKELSPPVVISPNDISVFLFNNSSEKLVNELMSYAGGSVAEVVAMLNQWKHITLDLALIEQGLKNRQLDTVRFFLKMKNDDFTLLWASDTLKMNVTEEQVVKWVDKVATHMDEWNTIFSMLLMAVQSNIANAASRHFAEQLGQVVLQTITHMLNCVFVGNKGIQVSSVHSQMSHLVKDINSQLMKQVTRLRSLLEGENISGIVKAISNVNDSSNSAEINASTLFKTWNGMSVEAAIRNAICSRRIPLVQAWLLSEKKLEHQRKKGSILQFVQEVGMALVRECLEVRNINQARMLLSTLGFQAEKKLNNLFRTTPDRDLRGVLAVELDKFKVLSPEDKKILEKMHMIEQLYPCSSFQRSQELVVQNSSKNLGIISHARSTIGAPNLSMTEEEENISDEYTVSPRYFRFIFDWMQNISDVCCERILIPGLWNENASWVRYQVNPQTVWRYLLDYCGHQNIKIWIKKWFSPFLEVSNSEFPYDWPIDAVMVNTISSAPQHTSEFILDNLVRYGVISDEELHDVTSLFQRVGHVCNVLSNPLRLRHPDSPESDFDIQSYVLEYLLQNNLVNVLEVFVQDNRNVVKSSNTFLSMVLSFYEWNKAPDDPVVAFDAILSTAEYLYSLPNKSIQSLLDNGHIMLGLATLHLAPVNLCDVASNASVKWSVERESLLKAVQRYPLMKAVFFPNEDNVVQDISVYQLLQGSAPFDTPKLFGWQETNTVKNEDTLNCLPNFSLPCLVEQYGLNAELTFDYYLIQGRPGFAFMKFMADFLLKWKGPKHQKLETVCKQVTALALKHLYSSQITAACVVFLEMLGEDSLSLRVHLKIAHIIHQFCPEGFLHGKNILESLLILSQRKTQDGVTAAKAILDLLLRAFNNKFGVLNQQTYEECIAWRLIVKFCSLHNFPFPVNFLETCAKNGDWLMFFLHAQMFNYPRTQVLEAGKKFSNQFIAEHVRKVLDSQLVTMFEEIVHTKQNGRKLKSKKSTLQSKDLRTSLYAKIGLKKTGQISPTEYREKQHVDEDLVSLCSEDTQSLDYVPLESESGDYQLSLNEENCSIFHLLRQCEREDSWKPLLNAAVTLNNPLPALLAASFKNSLQIDCLSTFIFTLLSCEAKKAFMVEAGVESSPSSWTQMDFEILMKIAVKHREVKLLQLAFMLFKTDKLLIDVIEYLVCFLFEKNYDASAEKLKDFESHMIKYVHEVNLLPLREKGMFSDPQWVQKIIMLLFSSATMACTTTYEKLVLLRHYTFGDIQRLFPGNVSSPDFKKLYHLVQSMKTLEVPVPLEKLMQPKDSFVYISAVQQIVEQLQSLGLYSEAQCFAAEAQISTDQVIVNELILKANIQKEFPSWQKLSVRLNFWVECNEVMKKSHVHVFTAVDFFKNYKDKVISHKEKCILLMYILHWMDNVSSNRMEKRSSVTEYEKEMWLAFIKAEMETETEPANDLEVYEAQLNTTLFWEIMLSAFERDSHSYIDALTLDTGAYYDEVLSDDTLLLENEQETQILEKIVYKLLTKGLVWHAQKLATIFCCDNLELQIIMVALKIATGRMTYQDIPPFILTRLPLKEDVHQNKLSFLMIPRLPTDSGLATSSSQPIVQSYYTPEQENVLSVLGKLEYIGNYSRCLCNKILVHYRASCLLKEAFSKVIRENVFTIVKKLLKAENPEKYRLARELFAVHNLSDNEIATFLCSEIFSNQHHYYISVKDIESLSDDGDDEGWALYTPSNISWHFMQVSKLCSDPSLLGNRILSMASSDLEGKTRNELALEVELCIRSHDCFYVACNMEGISRILKKARTLTQALAQIKEYGLMVRLVTGIGHFSEMTYIFDILVENHQFELLLGKGTEKVSQLRIALLEYLKAKNYQDSDMYSFVALSFRLFREIAENRQSTAKKRLAYLYLKKPGLKEELEIALQEMADAAERFTNADCLQSAQKCVQQAELIALQLHLLSSGMWVVNLEEKAVSNFISVHPNFLEALIVAEAYNHPQSWSDALYCNVVEKGNWRYLEDFMAHLNLTPMIIEEVAQKYSQNGQKEKAEYQSNMQTLLGHLTSLEARYSLAKKLNFNTYANLLLENENSCYLHDIFSREQF